MTTSAVVSIICADRTGLVADITGRLYDLGVNLGDTSFAVLGQGAEFTSVCELPAGLTVEAVKRELRAIPGLGEAKLSVAPFVYDATHGPSAQITHHIEIIGDDSPGLIARLSETFVEFGVNIVRLNSERIPGTGGTKYLSRMEVWIPEAKADACLATVSNTAAQLGLACKWTTVPAGDAPR